MPFYLDALKLLSRGMKQTDYGVRDASIRPENIVHAS